MDWNVFFGVFFTALKAVGFVISAFVWFFIGLRKEAISSEEKFAIGSKHIVAFLFLLLWIACSAGFLFAFHP